MEDSNYRFTCFFFFFFFFNNDRKYSTLRSFSIALININFIFNNGSTPINIVVYFPLKTRGSFNQISRMLIYTLNVLKESM